MRSSCVLLAALLALAAYYVYIPLPSAVSDPWKLMLLDATFRGAQQVSNLIHSLGLNHHLIALNFIITSFGKQSARSSPKVKSHRSIFRSKSMMSSVPLNISCSQKS
ncbi:arylacetamide deacetylase-like 1, isoform CRA_a [Mus musculus]|nr:arylacetamide deacetylase-like 1, isoform CRA_a [Mus musculus]